MTHFLPSNPRWDRMGNTETGLFIPHCLDCQPHYGWRLFEAAL